MANIIIVWGHWGPYHCRRYEAFRDHAALAGHRVTGVSLFSGSSANQWRPEQLPRGVVHFDLGKDEAKFPTRKLCTLMGVPKKTGAEIALLPSYDHWSLVLNLAVRVAGGRIVMMNETHGGTARAHGWKAGIKQRIVSRFHAGFVGGAPHVRYFSSLGLPEHKIFTGYDAVDNDYFARRTGEVRNQETEFRRRYELPSNYFLGLGRFVHKKNFSTLICAYRKFLDSDPASRTHLVLVGAGEEDGDLRALSRKNHLPVYEKVSAGNSDDGQEDRRAPGVHFYGFRQINENPVFYALADAFVMPSLWEEWGLVVNEAMACGLPVVVSHTAGCAEDLLKTGWPMLPNLLTTCLPFQWTQMPGRIRRNGFVFEPTSASSLGVTLSTLATSPALRKVMGEASRTIIEDFSCEVFARNALLATRAAGNLPLPPDEPPLAQTLDASPQVS